MTMMTATAPLTPIAPIRVPPMAQFEEYSSLRSIDGIREGETNASSLVELSSSVFARVVSITSPPSALPSSLP